MQFVIQTHSIINSISNNICNLLIQLGHTCLITYTINKDIIDQYESSIFIILYPHTFDTTILPKNYIFYQIEQGQHYFNKPEFLNLLNGTEYIFDCSNHNPSKYSNLINTIKYVYPTPLPLPRIRKYIDIKNTAEQIYNNTKYDIIFYGTMNERRKNIIKHLETKYKILTVEHTFNEDRDLLLQKGKIILNLHYYDNHVLETCRFNESINFDRLIISENSVNDILNTNLYENIVILTDCIDNDLDNINTLCDKLDFYLNKENYINKFIHNYHQKFILNINVSELFKHNLNLIINNINNSNNNKLDNEIEEEEEIDGYTRQLEQLR